MGLLRNSIVGIWGLLSERPSETRTIIFPAIHWSRACRCEAGIHIYRTDPFAVPITVGVQVTQAGGIRTGMASRWCLR